jgi:hypothetical protein
MLLSAARSGVIAEGISLPWIRPQPSVLPTNSPGTPAEDADIASRRLSIASAGWWLLPTFVSTDNPAVLCAARGWRASLHGDLSPWDDRNLDCLRPNWSLLSVAGLQRL